MTNDDKATSYFDGFAARCKKAGVEPGELFKAATMGNPTGGTANTYHNWSGSSRSYTPNSTGGLPSNNVMAGIMGGKKPSQGANGNATTPATQQAAQAAPNVGTRMLAANKALTAVSK